MGSVHSAAYASMPGVDLVGIVDPRAAGPALAERLHAPCYGSWEALMAAENPDVIDVCVPTYLHRPYVERAAGAGKHVICEKPLARTLADGCAILAACKTAGVRLFLAHVVRFFPEYERARQQVEAGAVGKPGVIRTTRAGSFPTATEDWYAAYRRSGGLLLDLLIHDYDWLRWTFGEVERVFAKGLRGRDAQRLDYGLVTLRFRSGALAHVEGSWAHREAFHTRLEIAGTKGIIEFDSRQTAPVRIQVDRPESSAPGVPMMESPTERSPYYLELEHFIDCIRTGAEARVTAEDGYKALEIAVAALVSAASGRPAKPGEEEAL